MNNNKTSSKIQFVSHDKVLGLFKQKKGFQYFIPEGFEPILIPRNTPLQPIANLLQNEKLLKVSNQKRKQLKTQTNSILSNVRFPQLVLVKNKKITKAKKPKRPPRPPNAFILYRCSKKSDIVAQNKDISNNEVSKQIAEMWRREPLEVKMKYKRLADTAKVEHMKKYPEYKYRPRKPHEIRKRSNAKFLSSNNRNNTKNNNYSATNTSPIVSTVRTVSNEHDHSFSSIESVNDHTLFSNDNISTISTPIQFQYPISNTFTGSLPNNTNNILTSQYNDSNENTISLPTNSDVYSVTVSAEDNANLPSNSYESIILPSNPDVSNFYKYMIPTDTINFDLISFGNDQNIVNLYDFFYDSL